MNRPEGENWPHLLSETVGDLVNEVHAARKKFPGNKFLLTALMEEVGELAQAILQKRSPYEIRGEAKQVACLAIRIMEEGDTAYDDLTDEQAKA